jgi:hypothetical protein
MLLVMAGLEHPSAAVMAAARPVEGRLTLSTDWQLAEDYEGMQGNLRGALYGRDVPGRLTGAYRGSGAMLATGHAGSPADLDHCPPGRFSFQPASLDTALAQAAERVGSRPDVRWFASRAPPARV